METPLYLTYQSSFHYELLERAREIQSRQEPSCPNREADTLEPLYYSTLMKSCLGFEAVPLSDGVSPFV